MLTSNLKKRLQHFDYPLFIAVLGMSLYGVIMIGSATHINTNGPTSEFKMQIVWVVTGLVLLFLATVIDYNFILKFHIPIYLLNLFLLVLVLFVGNDGATSRWIRIGPGNLQPSEFNKIFMIIFMAKFLSIREDSINTIRTIMEFMLFLGIPTILVILQPSLSASLVPVFICAVMIFVSGLDTKIIYSILTIAFIVMSLMLYDISKPEGDHVFIDSIMTDYQISRVQSAMGINATEANRYQNNYAIQAIGSGELTGKGLYNGTINQLSFLPESHNDFIFSVVSEEFGFRGASLLIATFLFIIFRCFYIAHKAKSTEGMLLAVGVGSMIGFQTFVNIAVNTSILPNTGMPLPFMSYGGSSMLSSLITAGLLVRVARETDRTPIPKTIEVRG